LRSRRRKRERDNENERAKLRGREGEGEARERESATMRGDQEQGKRYIRIYFLVSLMISYYDIIISFLIKISLVASN
jgi:hypothetical protein